MASKKRVISAAASLIAVVLLGSSLSGCIVVRDRGGYGHRGYVAEPVVTPGVYVEGSWRGGGDGGRGNWRDDRGGRGDGGGRGH